MPANEQRAGVDDVLSHAFWLLQLRAERSHIVVQCFNVLMRMMYRPGRASALQLCHHRRHFVMKRLDISPNYGLAGYGAALSLLANCGPGYLHCRACNKFYYSHSAQGGFARAERGGKGVTALDQSTFAIRDSRADVTDLSQIQSMRQTWGNWQHPNEIPIFSLPLLPRTTTSSVQLGFV